jgi:spermidine/putrescine ABC transporter ATP-binding subunit
MPEAARIEYDDVAKYYGSVVAAEDVSFTIEPGEFVALLGPSGAGKTTLLRLLAGFETLSEGEIRLNGRAISDVPPNKRDTGMVFQDYALFPHMTVEENILFGLKRNGFSGSEAAERVAESLEMVDLAGYEDRYPSELSGGQQQRVATARAVAIQPAVLLMDEPLGALDKKLRDQLEVELKELQEELNITTMYVTHNQEEALTMADRIVVTNGGRIEQIGTPTEIYEEPATEFVAEFIGDTNFLDGEVATDGNRAVLRQNGHTFQLAESTVPDGDSAVFVRPEKIAVTAGGNGTTGDNVVSGTVDRRIFIGSNTRYFVSVNGHELVVEEQNREGRDALFDQGDDVDLVWDASDTHVVPSRS